MDPVEDCHSFSQRRNTVPAKGAPLPDQVDHPPHYTRYKIQPIDFIELNELPFWLGNVIKYGCRAGHKVYDDLDAQASEERDLEKGISYFQRRLAVVRGGKASMPEGEGRE